MFSRRILLMLPFTIFAKICKAVDNAILATKIRTVITRRRAAEDNPYIGANILRMLAEKERG